MDKKIVKIVLENNPHIGPTFEAFNASGECLGEWIEECTKGTGKKFSITEAAFGIAERLKNEENEKLVCDRLREGARLGFLPVRGQSIV